MKKKKQKRKGTGPILTPSLDVLRKREANPDEEIVRKATFLLDENGAPSTYNEDERSVEVNISTDGGIVEWSREFSDYVPRHIMPEGIDARNGAQVPILDSHNAHSVTNVLGSVRNMRAEGNAYVGKMFFADNERAQDALKLMKDGHLTDVSLRSRPLEYVVVSENESYEFEGRTYKGPAEVVTRSQLLEVSVTPIGADPDAVARSEKTEKKVNIMPEKLRKVLIERGLDKGATDEEAWEFFNAQPADSFRAQKPAAPAPKQAEPNKKADDKVDADAVRMAEQKRCVTIRKMCDESSVPEMAEKLINDNTDLASAEHAILRAEVALLKTSGPKHSVKVMGSGEDELHRAIEDGFGVALGVVKESKDLAEGWENYAGARGYQHIARSILEHRGLYRHSMSNDEIITRAMATPDFPKICGNIAQKAVLFGWESQVETWDQWASTGSVKDFKKNTSVRPTSFGSLRKINEAGEYKKVDRGEHFEEHQIDTYGEIFPLTRQALINDDLELLSDIPAAFGGAARRTVGDLVYGVLQADTMSDGLDVYHANHGNLAGSGAAPSVATIGAARLAMKTQAENGRKLNIAPQFFIAPAALETATEEFFGSGSFADGTKQGTTANQFAGKFNRIYEARLDDTSAVAWYMLTSKGKTVKVFFLNGQQLPFLETMGVWNTDGVEYKVRLDFGAKALDHKGMYKNPGV